MYTITGLSYVWLIMRSVMLGPVEPTLLRPGSVLKAWNGWRAVASSAGHGKKMDWRSKVGTRRAQFTELEESCVDAAPCG